MRRTLLIIALLFIAFQSFANVDKQKTDSTKKVYVFPIREDIMPSVAKLTSKCLNQAIENNSDYVIIEMNTYGGLLDAADSIRTSLLNYPLPVFVFINNQAISAGALIALAADKIYMREGSTIGAATVVGQDGQVMPDKHQSAMRSIMRSTAETHGKIAVISNSDTTWRWVRDPNIAEAMVGSTSGIEGLIEKDKVLSFTTEEAIKSNFCEGKASSVAQVLEQAGISNYEIFEYKTTWLDKLLNILTNPAFQGVLIMLIIGGIYFELQSPGIGFPLIIAILGATLYFAPLYIEGLVTYWEVILFIIGLILILVEVLLIPGFGVTGILGIVAVIIGLAFAMIDTDLLRYIPTGEISIGYLLTPLAIVFLSITLSLILSIWLAGKFLTGKSPLKQMIVLTSDLTAKDGFVANNPEINSYVGREGITSTALRPAGKVVIDGMVFDATSEYGDFIEKGEKITVYKDETGILYCKKVAS